MGEAERIRGICARTSVGTAGWDRGPDGGPAASQSQRRATQAAPPRRHRRNPPVAEGSRGSCPSTAHESCAHPAPARFVSTVPSLLPDDGRACCPSPTPRAARRTCGAGAAFGWDRHRRGPAAAGLVRRRPARRLRPRSTTPGGAAALHASRIRVGRRRARSRLATGKDGTSPPSRCQMMIRQAATVVTAPVSCAAVGRAQLRRRSAAGRSARLQALSVLVDGHHKAQASGSMEGTCRWSGPSCRAASSPRGGRFRRLRGRVGRDRAVRTAGLAWGPQPLPGSGRAVRHRRRRCLRLSGPRCRARTDLHGTWAGAVSVVGAVHPVLGHLAEMVGEPSHAQPLTAHCCLLLVVAGVVIRSRAALVGLAAGAVASWAIAAALID
jgi:hypothetical protein